ncbi:MAG: A/G-specific adenine glycosylase [Bacteroidota bacterium]|nr:A/G-specific adenine glycosylase [Bacteroidota bacterium]
MSVTFSNKLINWYNHNKRDLPWRKTKDPYKIWVSEIILQQTRIEFGIKYYNKFLKRYPDVKKLANSKEIDLMKIWEGLGYYSRAINMLKTAKIVLNSFNGVFPLEYEQLIQLPGVGDYTASAISSICNDELQVVVDGNVLRFLSRMHKIDLPIESIKTKKYFKKLGFKLIQDVKPGDFNQALMDYGSTICKPKKFDCNSCLFSIDCKAYNSNSVENYPVKKKKIKLKDRFLNYVVVVTNDNKTQIKKRDSSGIWKNLYEFPLIETKVETSAKQISKELDLNLKDLLSVKKINHRLSHQLLHITFFVYKVDYKLDDLVDINALASYPFPKPINKFISELV